jgi:hypothetical protein
MRNLERQVESTRYGVADFARNALPERLGITGLEAFGRSMAVSDTLSPLDRLSGARSQYADTLSAALGGDLDAARAFPGMAQQLLGIGRDVYASGGDYQNLFREVNASLSEVLERQRALAADITKDIPTTILETSNNEIAEVRRQTAALLEGLAKVEGELRRFRNEAA